MDDYDIANAELHAALLDQMHADSLLASANARVTDCRRRVHDLFRKRADEAERRSREVRRTDLSF